MPRTQSYLCGSAPQKNTSGESQAGIDAARGVAGGLTEIETKSEWQGIGKYFLHVDADKHFRRDASGLKNTAMQRDCGFSVHRHRYSYFIILLPLADLLQIQTLLMRLKIEIGKKIFW